MEGGDDVFGGVGLDLGGGSVCWRGLGALFADGGETR